MDDLPELTPVRAAHRIDEKALAVYLRDHMDGDFSNVEVLQFEGGQSNPTYQLIAGETRYVLRKKPPGLLLKSAHQIDREFTVMSGLQTTDVPVPEMYLLCEDETIIGTSFYVMEFVEGRVIVDPLLPSFTKEERSILYDDFIRILANLHAVDRDKVGLGEFGRTGNYYERQISRWSKQYKASETETLPDMDRLMEWLPANIPETPEATLVHGDYRIGNCIIHPTEPKIVAVIDWELSTTGHPLADVGYCCMAYHQNSVIATRQSPHLDSHPTLEMEKSGEEQSFDPEAPGIPTEAEFLNVYCQYTGMKSIENWSFYIIYNLFRIAAIVQGVYKRGVDGNASSDHWKEMHSRCVQYSVEAWRLVKKETL